ncbi:MAG: anti-sigma factor [Solirubrobacterales bacterium]|nr:anti-sigma factor [Solirubrobacterales bacterium]MBV9167489.1 anti-sigma factor [Solirubrobacterales bacterium]MBV9537235.1 anti-sigma factor [Solirubrobacterales bacterium]
MSRVQAMSGTHDRGDDAAAYVLGALEPAEAEQFRAHLDQCPVCRDEVAALERTAGALPMAAPQHPVPKPLRRRVVREVRADARGRRAASQLVRPRPSIGRARGALLIGGAAAAIALAVLGGIQLSSSSTSRVIRAQVSGISGSALLRVSGGRGELVVRDLSSPPPGKIYEVWLKRATGAPLPTQVLFSVTRTGGGYVGLPGDLNRFREVLVTPEPAGGSLVPTHTPVIVVRLS